MNGKKHREINKDIVKRDAIRMAAGLAKGDCLSRLLGKCEDQKTVRTTVIANDLADVHEYMKKCAIQMRKLYDLLD